MTSTQDLGWLLANFADREFFHGDIAVPSRSILARWPETGATRIFTPLASSPE